jgi:hypothetical protein
VAHHRVAHRLADHEPAPGNRARVGHDRIDPDRIDHGRAEAGDLLGRDGVHDEPGAPNAASLPGHEPKVVATGQSTGRGEQAQADRLLRPLRRRAARIARPARVRMRRRNPWVRARRRLFGWKVRLLTAESPGTGSSKYVCPRRGLPARRTHPQLTGDLHRVRTPAPANAPGGALDPPDDTPRTLDACFPDMPCGMAWRLLACVLLVGQSGVGARAPRR